MNTAPRPFTRLALWAAAALLAAACGKSAPTPASAPAAPAEKAAAAEKTGGSDKAAAVDPAAAASAAVAEEDQGPPRTVTIWHGYRDAEREALDNLVSHWNKNHPNLQISTLAVPPDAIIDKFQVAVPNGNGPDLIIFAHDKIGLWARAGLIQPLGDFATPERLKRFMPQAVKPLVHDKAIYGLPMAYKTLVLFYNKAMVKEPPKSLTQLIEVAKGFTKPDADAFGLAYEASNLYFHAPILLGLGGAVYDDVAKKVMIDSPEAQKAMDIARDLYKTHKILPQGAVSGFALTAMFKDNKVPFVFQGPWFIGELTPEPGQKPVEWGVALLPEVEPGKPMKPFLGSEALLLSAKAPQAKSALRVIDFLTSDEAALTRIQLGKQMVANVKTYEQPKWSDDPVVKVFRGQAEMSLPMPSSAEMSAVWNPYNAALQKGIYGEGKSVDVLGEAQKRAEEDIGKMAK